MKKIFIRLIYIFSLAVLVQQVPDQSLFPKAFAKSEEAHSVGEQENKQPEDFSNNGESNTLIDEDSTKYVFSDNYLQETDTLLSKVTCQGNKDVSWNKQYPPQKCILMAAATEILSKKSCTSEESTWEGDYPPPDCLLELAARIRVLFFPGDNFTSEEKAKIKSFFWQEAKIKENLIKFACPPGVEEEWASSSIQKPAPQCVLERIEKSEATWPENYQFVRLEQPLSKKLYDKQILNLEISRLIKESKCQSNIQECIPEFIGEVAKLKRLEE